MHPSNLPYFMKSCNKISQVPQFNIKSIIIAGRSNVGKSSLINAIAKTKIAKTSKSPGCTKSLNFFNFLNKFILVDMPGYGFAKVSLALRNEWNDFIYEYLSNFDIAICLVLIDSKVGFKQTDFEMIHLLIDLGIKYIVVFTKTDKVSKVHAQVIEDSFIKIGDKYEYIVTSSKNKIGVKELSNFLYSL